MERTDELVAFLLRDEGSDGEEKPRMINHHGKAIAVKPFLRTVSEHQIDENGRNGGTSVMAFFNNKVRDEIQDSSPTPSVPLVKDILKAKNLNISDLISRKEEVSERFQHPSHVRAAG